MSSEGFEVAERSTLDRDALRDRLASWLAGRLGDGARVEISQLASPSANGMSSETLLFDAQIEQDGEAQSLALVARLAPSERDVPVFPRYELASQFRLLERVARADGVPVPGVRWLEEDAEALGAPFFVMDRVEGRVPPDIPPYPFSGWIFDAKPEQRAELETSTVAAIAALHAIPVADGELDFLAFDARGDTPLRRHVQNQRDFYAWTAADGVRHPLVERAFTWLDAHWPAREGAAAVSWGDSRIGNVLYDGFEPAALLDWEMAALGPRELDLAWLCFMHRFFHDIAVSAGLPGLPDFLRLASVAERYERATGHEPQHLHWFYTYAALRHAIIMARIHRRMVHFGRAERPGDPDAVIPHAALLAGLIDGSVDPLA